jgi:hypothetical protein
VRGGGAWCDPARTFDRAAVKLVQICTLTSLWIYVVGGFTLEPVAQVYGLTSLQAHPLMYCLLLTLVDGPVLHDMRPRHRGSCVFAADRMGE